MTIAMVILAVPAAADDGGAKSNRIAAYLGATIGWPKPRFVYPYPDDARATIYGLGRFEFAKDWFAVQGTGRLGLDAQNRAYGGSASVDGLRKAVRLGFRLSAAESRSRFPLYRSDVVSLDTLHKSQFGTAAVLGGRGSLAGSFWRIGPTAGFVRTDDKLALRTPLAPGEARDDFEWNGFLTYGVMGSGNTRFGRLRVRGTLTYLGPIPGSGKRAPWRSPFAAIEALVSMPVVGNWSVALEGAYASPRRFDGTPVNTVGIGIGYEK